MTRGGGEWAGSSGVGGAGVCDNVGKSEVCHFAIIVSSSSPGINNGGKHDRAQHKATAAANKSQWQWQQRQSVRRESKKQQTEGQTHLYCLVAAQNRRQSMIGE